MKLGIGEFAVLSVVVSVVAFRCLSPIVALLLLAAILIAICRDIHEKQQLWKRLGVSGPRPLFYFGNVLAHRRGWIDMDAENLSKYGKVYGSYLFTHPEIIIADKDLAKKIMIKDFNYFVDHTEVPIGQSPGSLFNKILLSLRGQRWRDVRNTVTPTFTAGKMKQMIHMLNDGLNTFAEILNEKTANGLAEIDIKEYCSLFTLDSITQVAFGLKVDAQREPTSAFVRHALAFNDVRFTNLGALFVLFFPGLSSYLSRQFGVLFFFGDGERFFNAALRAILDERKQNPQKTRHDFLQLCLDTLKQGDAELAEAQQDTDIWHKNLGGAKIKISEDEIIANSLFFLIAGYNNNANVLHTLLYLLAVHPDEQQRCLDQVRHVVGEEQITYDMINRLTYIEAVMNETLRLFPLSCRLSRRCTEAYRTDDGLYIPAGADVYINVHHIHHSAEFYTDPEKFQPERFLPENRQHLDQSAFMPFGGGPRNCIGMRFALMQLKMAVAFLLPKFEFCPTDKTEPMPLKIWSLGVARPLNTIYLGVKRREQSSQ